MVHESQGVITMALPAGSPPVCFIITADRAKAKAFYVDVVGLRLMGEDDHAVTFDAGNRTPMRLTEVPGFKAMGHTVLGWHVADIGATARALVAKGAKFNIYPGFDQDADGVWASPGGGAKVAWFNDPDGNVLSLTQVG
jgi:catechol 2,3-dioxygenase-like lactoylglutathione lyase family enzyme